MFWTTKNRRAPGAYDREQAAKCRLAAQVARDEGDAEHADLLEISAELYDKAALGAVRADREKRLGATPYSFDW